MNLKRLWRKLSKRRKLQFCAILILMIVSSFAEVISLGVVIPFLGVLTAPEFFYNHSYAQPIIQFFDFSSPDQLLLPITALFVAAILIASTIRLLLIYLMTHLSYASGADLSIGIYRRTLYQDYSVHISRNSSEIINGIIRKTDLVVGGIIGPVLILTSSVILIIGVVGALFTINPLVALATIFGFGIVYLGVMFFTRIPLKRNSKSIASDSNLMVKSLQEGLGGIRDVIIDGSQEFYCNIYQSADLPYRRALASNSLIGENPRNIVEGLGMTIIVLLAYTMTQNSNTIESIIPILGAFALGAQRLLPAMQQAYRSYSAMQGSLVSFEEVLDLLDQPLPDSINMPRPKPISFNKEIQLINLSFRYSKGTPLVLANVNLKIAKGSRVGFIGTTGSGKSTLLDIIMGMLNPTEGFLAIDGKAISVENNRSWQEHISHVPQHIYLSDDTIESNIAFGVKSENVDLELVRLAAKKAQISELIEGWKDKYQTNVGERGIRLSGGQRQRIGIARALYKKTDVLILDEATSSLDTDTEHSIMSSIGSLGEDLTILIIAHRVTTLKDCDQIIEVNQKGLSLTSL
jgi:ABC-type multidrug transport system fused ATPase/permease subunit